METIDEILAADELAYFTFRPRPDQPERHDQQESFYHSRTPGVSFLIGGNGAGTTEVACAKIAKFVFETPPPRKDTPFWIISGSYEQTMKTAWKEKLYGHGHIPGSEVEWDRIRWFKSSQQWPFEVPLRPWPNRPGKNWSLVFKSYEQGRGSMQAESIGGFCFIEQFPWVLLEEVLRGCREYNFPGSKFCEFTPVDPSLSIEVEEILDESRERPAGWEFYRANTQCAMEAGHVSAEWFDEFFGMVPEEMRETRMTGAAADYEGQIYKGFNPAVHLVGDETITFPPNIRYIRMIDWGAGPSNAFCCLWAYRNGLGEWFVFDEYYSTDQYRTTIDHLCEVSDRWPWPAHNPHYGRTWADPSNPDGIRIASKFRQYCPKDDDGNPRYEAIAISGAANTVLEGIEHVQWLLQPKTRIERQEGQPSTWNAQNTDPAFRPRLFIHRKNCPMLARQMRTYRWENPRLRGINPRDAKRQPLKKDDHACFPAGQIIDTPRGPRPIETIRSGDAIYTHRGEGVALSDATITGIRSVKCLILADGRNILCTAEHPIGTSAGEWRRADQCEGERVHVRSRFARKRRAAGIVCSLSNTLDSSGVDTRIRRITGFAATTAERSAAAVRVAHCVISGCTRKSIARPTARFRSRWSFTTKMATTTTTASGTLDCKRHRNTPAPIGPTSTRRLMRHETGIRPMLVGSGIVSTAGLSRHPKRNAVCNASIARSGIGRKTAARLAASVATTAEPQPGGREETITLIASARSAGKHFASTDTSRRRLARRNVSECSVVEVRSLDGVEPVYALATSDGSFFVNGLLVSNCDALRYGVFSEARHTGELPTAIARERSGERHGVRLARGVR